MKVECVAPMPPAGSYKAISGTSMASPHVAGVAGLVKSVAPKAAPEKLKKIIMRSVVPTKSLKGKTATGGRVSAARAVRFIRPANRARLHRLRVSPKKLRLRPGSSARLKVRVRNGGGVTARRLRICVKAPRRFVSRAGCTKPRRLGWGETAKFGLRIRLKGGARSGRSIRLKTVVRARGAGKPQPFVTPESDRPRPALRGPSSAAGARAYGSGGDQGPGDRGRILLPARSGGCTRLFAQASGYPAGPSS